MKTKQALQVFSGLITFFVTMPLGWIITYNVYKHIEAPELVWVLWIIQLPLMILSVVFIQISKNIKE